MNEDPEATRLLRALGHVEPPVPGVLETAREVLWSAVAAETLSLGAADEARTGDTDRSRPGIRRHRAQRDESGP